MRVGVIGSGRIGGTLAALLAAAGHDVQIANSRGPESLRELAGERLTPATVEAAAEHGEAVLVATPLTAYAALPARALAGTVVIDAGNYYPRRDGQIAALDDDRTTSTEWLAAKLPGADASRRSTRSTGSSCATGATRRPATTGSSCSSRATTRTPSGPSRG